MASVPFEFACDKATGFVVDPNEHKRVGYITAFNGIGLSTALTADLQVSVPFNAGAKLAWAGLPQASPGPAVSTTKVVGVIETFDWDGGVGGVIKLDLYVSKENATQLKALQQAGLKTTAVDALSWWIVDYDPESKAWFEESYPGTAIAGIVGPKDNPELTVDLTPIPVKDGIDVYKVSIQVAPAANQQYTLHLADSSTRKVAKNWGLVVGTLPSQGVPAGT